MRPGYLRVFDGLRLTTEHIEHLQNACHLALQDLRQAIGRGKVHSGFEVERGSANKIVVGPGFAFDFQRNQIVNDEPRTLEVSFGPSQEVLHVCIKYDRLETEKIEEKPTMIWDSCEIIIRPDPPSQTDNQLAIACLRKRPGTEIDFDIVGPTHSDWPATDAPPIRGRERRNGNIAPPLSKDSQPDIKLSTASVSTLGNIHFSGQLAFNELLRRLDDNSGQPTDEASQPPAEGRRCIVLEEHKLAVPTSHAGIILDAVATGHLRFFASAGTTPIHERRTAFQVTAHAEATYDGRLRQYSVAAVQASSNGSTIYASNGHDDAILKLKLTDIQQVGGVVTDSSAADFLSRAVFGIKISRAADGAMTVRSFFAHSGAIVPAPVQTLDFELVWNANAVWKATY